jgi:hypothetical protein
MGSVKTISLVISASLLLLIVLYGLCRFVASWQKSYSWKEMDWNQDGTTTLSEVLEASDVGRRAVNREGKRCMEYYSFKDGLTIRMDCPK